MQVFLVQNTFYMYRYFFLLNNTDNLTRIYVGFFWHLSIWVECFTITFLSVISRTSSRDSKHCSAIYQKVMFCIELVNISFKQETLDLNQMYLQFLDNVAWISWEKQGNACPDILRHSRDPTEL